MQRRHNLISHSHCSIIVIEYQESARVEQWQLDRLNLVTTNKQQKDQQKERGHISFNGSKIKVKLQTNSTL